VVRSAVQSRAIGFTPGSIKEKEEPYFAPHKDSINKMMADKNAAKRLESAGTFEYCSTTFLRGTTIDNTIVIYDEFQSCTLHEFSTVMTRIGKNSRIIVCGDLMQNDLFREDKYDAQKAYQIMKEMRSFDFVEFGVEDIVRGPFVKDFLIAKAKLGH
jgi:phosphate starvation-inducible protein PhoH